MPQRAPGLGNSRSTRSSVTVDGNHRETFRRPDARLLRFDLAIPGRRVANERLKQMLGGVGHVVHRAVERLLVRFRWFGEAAQLAHELKRRGANLVMRRRRQEVVKGLDVSAHDDGNKNYALRRKDQEASLEIIRKYISKIGLHFWPHASHSVTT